MREENEKTVAPPCAEFEERLFLYAADELGRGTRQDVEEHVKGCASCAAALEGERQFTDAVAGSASDDPDARLLALCRSGLSDALDQTEAHQSAFRRWTHTLALGSWIAQHPAVSAAVLILAGFSVGTTSQKWMTHPVAPSSNPVTTTNASLLDDQQLRSANVSDINWTPAGDNSAPEVQVDLQSVHPVTVRGTVNDSNVKHVLIFLLQNNQRYAPDMRMNSVELLQPRSNDSDVRDVLCQIARSDPNPAVRLKALEALLSADPQQESVRDTVVTSLSGDTNTGVRVEAMNVLERMSEKGPVLNDPKVIAALRQRQSGDSNAFIRLQSAALLEQAASRAKY
ncbi:MAG: HEAT repeat domain-containing protein [Candidatus Acidiferrales bacterium]